MTNYQYTLYTSETNPSIEFKTIAEVLAACAANPSNPDYIKFNIKEVLDLTDYPLS